jgi:hypothetical protein
MLYQRRILSSSHKYMGWSYWAYDSTILYHETHPQVEKILTFNKRRDASFFHITDLNQNYVG